MFKVKCEKEVGFCKEGEVYDAEFVYRKKHTFLWTDNVLCLKVHLNRGASQPVCYVSHTNFCNFEFIKN